MKTTESFFNACKNGDLKTLKEIFKSEKINTEVKSPEGWTGLIISCFNENYEVVKFLIENNANVNATNSKGTSVFMYAKTPVQKNQKNTKILELLLESGADINHLDCFNKSVLDYVIENNAPELANWLISKGAQSGKTIFKK